MAREKVQRGACLATIPVDRDYRRDYENLLAYWGEHGINRRYLNPTRKPAFNCALIGDDLFHSDQGRRQEAQLALMGLYLYPVATVIKRTWHFPDDQPGREKAWDEVEQAAAIISEVLEALARANQTYDPTRGDLCHFLLLPERIAWGKFRLERERFGRKESDRQLANWREHPFCGDINCPICAARHISTESYVEDSDDEAQDGTINTYAHSKDASHIRLPGEGEALVNHDQVAEEVTLKDTPWWDLARAGIISINDATLSDLRYEYELTHEEIAGLSGKPAATVRKVTSRTRSNLWDCTPL